MRLGLQTRLYNAEVRNRRLERGLTQKGLAALIGYHPNSCIVGQVENLTIVDKGSVVVQKLAEFFGTSAEALCPEWLSMMRNVPKADDRQAEFSKANLERKMYSLLALPPVVKDDQDADVDRSFMRDAILRSMEGLKPRERTVLGMLMGVPDGVEHTLSQVAAAVGLSRQRVSQIKIAALKKLKSSAIGHGLRPFAQQG